MDWMMPNHFFCAGVGGGYFIGSMDSSANLLQKHPHLHDQKCLIWAPHGRLSSYIKLTITKWLLWYASQILLLGPRYWLLWLLGMVTAHSPVPSVVTAHKFSGNCPLLKGAALPSATALPGLSLHTVTSLMQASEGPTTWVHWNISEGPFLL